MADPKENKRNTRQSRIIKPDPIEPLKNVSSDADLLVHNYQDDSDFDDAFKNLLHPIEIITKKSNNEYLKHDLLKELDSYLNHLRDSSDDSSSIFVEAALMIQNVIHIYQKRVDRFIEIMTKLIGKFRDYRLIQNGDNINNDEVENQEGNKKKKKEKRVKYYATLEPIITFQTIGTSKMFDSKLIDLRKRPTIRKLVLNANVKVENQFNSLLPYIYIRRNENNGKKYDFLISCPLNSNLAVNEEIDWSTKYDDQKSDAILIYRKSTDTLPVNMMEVDDTEFDESLPHTPNPVNFDQTLNDEVCVANAMLPNSALNILNASQIPTKNDVNEWALITNANDDLFSDKPLTLKKIPKPEDNFIWIPTYTVPELITEVIKLKSGIPVDPSFRKLIKQVQEVQNNFIIKNNKKNRIINDKLRLQYFDAETDKRLMNGEEPGFKGFESPLHDDFMDMDNEDAVPDEPNRDGTYLTYVANKDNLYHYQQDKAKYTNDKAAMIKRVQDWHENLRPILEEEETRHQFDIHEYGTRILNCFKSIGEQISFNHLVAGLSQEEVARYYLSTLMMTNTYNLKIINSGNDKIIELLKRERHHEELQVNIGNQLNQ